MISRLWKGRSWIGETPSRYPLFRLRSRGLQGLRSFANWTREIKEHASQLFLLTQLGRIDQTQGAYGWMKSELGPRRAYANHGRVVLSLRARLTCLRGRHRKCLWDLELMMYRRAPGGNRLLEYLLKTRDIPQPRGICEEGYFPAVRRESRRAKMFHELPISNLHHARCPGRKALRLPFPASQPSQASKIVEKSGGPFIACIYW